MPGLRTYAVFICHDWEYSNDYHRVCDFLNNAPNFQWRNLSVSEHDPLDGNDRLQKNLRDQIRPADVVLVLAGMYAVRSGGDGLGDGMCPAGRGANHWGQAG